MDPLSASASVTAVLQLTATVIKYLNCVKGATSERQRLLSELCSINSILYTLQDQAENEADDDTVHRMFASLQVSGGPLEQFKSTLERLKSKLAPTRNSSTMVESIIWPFKKDEIKDLLQAIERQKTLFTLARQNDLMALFKAIHGNVNNVHNEMEGLRKDFRRLEANAEYECFITWLKAPDPWINQTKAAKLRHEHTGNWFIDSNAFKEWMLATPSSLWLHGIPGCGKTILISTIVQHLFKYQQIDPKTTVIFYYFDFNDTAKQTCENLLRSLIKQLVSQHNPASEQTQPPYESWQHQYKEQSEDQLLSMFHRLLPCSETVYLVVDALDECVEKEDLLRIIQQWTSWDDIRLHIIFASRKEREIEEVLGFLCDGRRTVCIQSTFVDQDIHDYVQARLGDDMRLKRWRDKPQVQQLIVDSLMEKAMGMFRWAACQLDALGGCLTEAKLREALHALPQTLDETYARILANIRGEYQNYVLLILQWLCFSPEPLRLEELAEVVAVTNQEPWIHPKERLADSQDVLTVCSSLITTESRPIVKGNIDPAIFYCQCRDRIHNSYSHPEYHQYDSRHHYACKKCDCLWPYSDADHLRRNYHATHSLDLQIYARLAHFSVKEYLTSARIPADTGFSFRMCEQEAHLRMYDSCLAYLLHMNTIDRDRRDLWLEYPLIFHATRHWQSYAQSVERHQHEVPELALRFLLNEDGCFATWLAMSHDFGSPLYHASRHGLWRSVKVLLDHGMDVHASSGSQGTAIEVAAFYGHEKVVELLIINGANVNSQYKHDPLGAAVHNRHRSVVLQLLENGADVNSRGNAGWNVLYAHRNVCVFELAIRRGDEDIVQMMLDHGAELHTWRDALMTAIMYRRIPMIRRLLSHRFEATQHRIECIRDVLPKAIMRKNAPTVKLMLDQLKSEGGIIDSIGRKLLSHAAQTGDVEILSMLMTDFVQCVDVADNDGRTLLSYAAESGDGATLEMLLEHNARDIDLADDQGRTPLSYAAGMGLEGHETAAMLLRYKSVDANSQDNTGRTPLSYAVAYRSRRSYCVVETAFESSTQLALERERHQIMVQMLLDHDKTASETQDHNGWTPLFWAIEGNSPHIVELLLSYGHGGLDQMCKNGETLIADLYARGSAEMLRLLSEHEMISFEELDNDDRAWGVMLRAVSSHHTELVNLLLQISRLHPCTQDERGRTLISLAAEIGNEEILKSLLSIDSSTVDLPDKAGRTPLSYACSASSRKYHDKKARLLLHTYSVKPDIPDVNCRAPISYAAEAAEFALLTVLLEHKVDINRADNQGRTPLSYAAGESNDAQVLESIFEKSTTAKDYADHAGRTPLSYAAGKGRRGAVRFFLRSGSVEMNTPDKRGLTPLAYAEMGKMQVAKYMPVGGGEVEHVGMPSEYHARTSEILKNHGAYRLDFEKAASEGWEWDAESGGSEDFMTPEYGPLTAP